MASFREFFQGKRITVMGLGLLGRGIGDVRFLAQCGADLIVTDLKSKEALAASLKQLEGFPYIHYTLGEHKLEDFRDRDLVINGPGVPKNSPFLKEARNNNIPITMSTALFSRFSREMGARIVGITGTRGKSTTTQLIYEILREVGLPVVLGGNIKGVSTLALLPQVTPDTVAVLELDSWQLQGFREECISPQIAVFTTLYPDHLNYYHQDMDAYLDDKAQIFLYQKPQNLLILGEQVAARIQSAYADRIASRITIARASDVLIEWKLRIPGIHNRQNAACAIAAARELHIADEIIRRVSEQFSGVEGRLQFLREVGGVRVYNDTTATTPEATIAALEALDPEKKKNIILIMGGADKGLAMIRLIEIIPRHCKVVILLAGTGTTRIQPSFPDAPLYTSLHEALTQAVSVAQVGDTVLLSPAFASFGMFANEYERGEQFTDLVSTL